jgi:pterin-4a-carbinolamine dehydratase
MNQIGRIADEMDHHPEWTLSTDNLQVNLNTHEIQGISEKDYLLAYVF